MVDYLSIKDLVAPDATFEVTLRNGKKVKLRYATNSDRIMAHEWASRSPSWSKLGSVEKELEALRMLALIIMVEPKITYEDYLKFSPEETGALIEQVLNAYFSKLSELKSDLGSFLESLESSVRSSTPS